VSATVPPADGPGELGGPEEQRRAELAANLTAVRARIGTACTAVGRDPGSVRLIAVTKTYPPADVLHLAALGVTDIGENRDQEAAAKAAEVRAAGVDVRWHFVGQLQRNKCRSVVGYADLVHSVDRVRLVQALEVAVAQVRRRPLDVLVQVSLDGDVARGGAVPVGPGADQPTDLPADHLLDRVVAAIAQASMLRLVGVMAVAPIQWDPNDAFVKLAKISAWLQERHPAATEISAGMSHDLEPALAHGATLVRIGTSILGNRPPLL
jgi:pyridoxal phosphate enzyme (YggS family)